MGTSIWCPRAQASLNTGSRDLDRWNLRLMLKISYAGCPGPPLEISVQFAVEMIVEAQNRQKIHKNLYFIVQGHQS